VQPYLKKFITQLPVKISHILKKMNLNEKGVLFLVNNDFKIKGSISDGDIRRYLLKGGKLDNIVELSSSLINKKTIVKDSKSSIEEILRVLNSKINNKEIKCLPLVDKQLRIIDISTKEKIRGYPLASPIIGEQELANIVDVVKSGWISSRGSYISKFEKKFEKYLGGGNAIALTNATNALQIGLMALGIKKGDEVILPNFTFGGTINAVLNAGAVPVIADVCKNNWTLNSINVKKKLTKKTKAIMPVHIYGQPYEILSLKKIAKKKNLVIIDDCAEAIGAKYKGKIVGLENDCSCFSFFANKTITTGEGGMAVFKKKEHANKARILINQGLSTKIKYYHEYAGSNFRMTNMQASIGVAQLDIINKLLKIRKNVFKIYNKFFKNLIYLTLIPQNRWSENSYWLYTLIIKNIGQKKRDKLIFNLQKFGIECRPGFYSLNKMQPFKKYAKGKFNNSNYLSENSLSLPTTNLTKKDQEYIVRKFLDEYKKIK
jgi:perosamine synthetase